jgi:hypothetical protein
MPGGVHISKKGAVWEIKLLSWVMEWIVKPLLVQKESKTNRHE